MSDALGYAYIPLISLVGIGILALILRWAHSPGRRVPWPSYGMLTPVARARTEAQAEATAVHLRSAGIRASVTHDPRGWLVLAWREQAPTARAVLAVRKSARKEPPDSPGAAPRTAG
ncbi:UNVERIFIED_CONTAM: hypothetical protein LK11_06690 [Mumia flava]|nr:hypothetical protein [Mumia flava]